MCGKCDMCTLYAVHTVEVRQDSTTIKQIYNTRTLYDRRCEGIIKGCDGVRIKNKKLWC